MEIDISKPSKQGYQIITAYSEKDTDGDVKFYLYLFVLHDNKPEVLVAHMPETMGYSGKDKAINFIPSKNEQLGNAFNTIMNKGEIPQVKDEGEKCS